MTNEEWKHLSPSERDEYVSGAIAVVVFYLFFGGFFVWAVWEAVQIWRGK